MTLQYCHVTIISLFGYFPITEGVRQLICLDQSATIVRDTLSSLGDDKMFETWCVKLDGEEILSMPRVGLLRSIMLNYWYHHRGQLGVYLRLLGCQVPSSYGPSGDELPDFLKGKVPALS